MKILAVSFGRKMHNCDILSIHALKAAQEAGAQVKLINTMNLNISHCRGCGACSAGRDKGKQIRCVINDDYLMLEDAILDADGVIVAAPVYALAPTGQMKNFDDRFGAAHDLAAATEEQKKRKAEGKELLDERLFRDKWVAYISVGGCHTPNWVSMGLPNFYMFGMSTCWTVVGQIDAYDMGHKVNPVLDETFMDRVAALGRHLAESIGKPKDEVTWLGEEGVCPVCHNKFISISEDHSTEVECPMCGIRGTLEIVDGKVKVTFSEKEQQRARNTLKGLYEHYYELQEMNDIIKETITNRGGEIQEKMKEYQQFENTY